MYRTIEQSVRQHSGLTVSSHMARYAAVFFALLRRWQENHKSRRALAVMPEHLLDDIGITKQQATQESQRYFWD